MTRKRYAGRKTVVVVLILILILSAPIALSAQADDIPTVPVADIIASNWDELYRGLWAARGIGTPWRIEIDRDFSLSAEHGIFIWRDIEDVTIASTPGNQFTITQPHAERHMVVWGSLTLENIIIDGGSSDSIGGGFRVNAHPPNGDQNTSLIISEGAILRNNSAENGGAVFAEGNATIILDGGMIENNHAVGPATGYGGGMYVQNGATFEIRSGAIQNNTARYGAGAYVAAASAAMPVSFRMTGGEISGNIAGFSGAGTYLMGMATLHMDGGKINGNTAASVGGGVYVSNNSTFNMVSGEVNGNTATGFGGGIYVGGMFNLTNGEINGNTAGTHGGGMVSGPAGTLNLQGGTVSENSAAQYGGGIRIGLITALSTRNSVINGVTIADNQAAVGGAGIAASLTDGATLTITDSKITGNHYPTDAMLNGGGVFISAGQVLISDSDIRDNQAAYGGGLFSDIAALVDVSDSTIADNTAAFDGGGMFNSNYDYSYPILSADAYGGLTVDSAVVFRGNRAGNGSFPPPHNAAAVTGMETNTNVSAFDHPLNNDDINFVPDLLRVTFAVSGGGTLNGETADVLLFVAPNTVLSESDVPLVAANPGWVFSSWTASNPLGHTVTEDITFTAVFTAESGGTTPPPPTPLPPPPPPPPLPRRDAYLIGYDGLIRPSANITRAEAATILFRVISDDMRATNWSQTNPYPDVVAGDWFHTAVSTTTQLGIFQGRPDGTFAPNQPITRAELAAVITRFMDVMDMENVDKDFFNDIAGHWANGYINVAAQNNWVIGPEGHGGAFYPDQPITRAETAAMVNRIFERLPETPADLLPDMVTWSDNADVDEWYYLYIQAASNSYTFTRRAGGYENWIAILPVRDWVAIERGNMAP